MSGFDAGSSCHSKEFYLRKKSKFAIVLQEKKKKKQRLNELYKTSAAKFA
jgi:hypothetical protein